MDRSSRYYALAGVLLLATLLLATLPGHTDASPGRVRRESPWLHRAPNTFTLAKKFARNRPHSSTTLALETNAAIGPVRPSSLNLQTAAKKQTTAQPDTDGKPASRSRAFYSCMSSCLTLSQYSPVCGSDHTTYHNEYKLECANRCGASPRVSITKSGIC